MVANRYFLRGVVTNILAPKLPSKKIISDGRTFYYQWLSYVVIVIKITGQLFVTKKIFLGNSIFLQPYFMTIAKFWSQIDIF